MKRFIVALLTFTISVYVYGQAISTTYDNEWIDFEQTYFKVKLNKTGLYRVNQSVLQSVGINAKGSDLKMYYKGEEVPIFVSNNDAFGSNDYVEFFGEKNDGEFDTQLFKKPEWQLTPVNSLFTDSSAYFIAIESGEHLRYENKENNISNPPIKEEFYTHESINVFNNIFNPGKRVNIGGTGTSFADFDENEGFTSVSVPNNEVSFTRFLETPSIFFNGGQASITTKFIGLNNDPFTFKDHPITVSFNSTVYHETNFEGYDNTISTFNVPLGELTNAQTTVLFTALPPPNPTSTNNFVTAYMNLTYPSTFDFENTRSRIFEIDNDGDKYIEVSNFNGGSQFILYDLTNKQRIAPIEDNGVYKFLIKEVIGSNAKRKLILSSTSSSLSTRRINKIETVQFTDFSKAENQGNYIILSHPLLMQGEVDEVERYRAYRSSTAGGSYNPVVVNIEELYDQFAWGIRKHPMSIRSFVNYAVDQWNGQAKLLLLLGKSIEYRAITTSSTFQDCLVPTYGHSGSDILLTTRSPFTYTNQLALGRVPARSPSEVKSYLDKIIEYETLPEPCSTEGLLWRKHALHIAGGTNLAEAADFIETLSIYKDVYEGINYGGKVIHTYNKFSDDVIEEADLSNFINPGLGIINFVGHGTGNKLNVNIEALEQENYGRYPFIFASSCFAGDIHNTNNLDIGMAQEFIFAPNLGSIGFLASNAVGFPVLLDQYVQGLFNNFTTTHYNQPIGISIQENILALSQEYSDPNSPFFNGVKFNAIFFTLSGDPAVVLNPLPIPEYRVDEASISFDPPQITTDLDSFALNIIVQNIGKAIEDSVQLVVNRQLPNSDIEVVFNQKIPSPKYADTLQVFVQMGDPAIIGGNNIFEVLIDEQSKIEELCESNNNTFKETTIFSNQVIPIFPCEFAIVSDPNVSLTTSTGQPLLDAYDYQFQIDTTTSFDSPLLQSHTLNSGAGVISWQPNINFLNNTVYYWRSSRVPDNIDEIPSWAVSSFLFEADATNGWNQSHHYQFGRNRFNGISLDDNTRDFNYDFVTNKISIVNNRMELDNISIKLNNEILHDINTSPSTRASCLGDGACVGGLGFVIFKPKPILEPILSPASERSGTLDCGGTGKYGNNHCELNDMYAIEFSTGIDSRLASMQTFMNETIEDGDYVLIYSISNHRLFNAVPGDPIFPYISFIDSFFENMGIPVLDGLNNNRGFIAFGRKGIPEYPANIQLTIGNLSVDDLVVDLEIDVRDDNGSLSSPPIGPAKNWKTLSWAKDNMPADNTNLRVYGIGSEGSELINGNLALGDININSIDAAKYPFLRLELKSTDETERTPPQLDYWKVNFDGVGELALDTKTAFSFETDTLFEGQTGSLSFGFTNASDVDMDSILVHYTLIDRNNVSALSAAPRYKPLAAGESHTASFSFETNGLSGNNVLLVELNPSNDQLEKRDFNNVLVIPFFVVSDKVNPILDVTFDGRHILDGDLVSTDPTILIRVKDDNPFFALNDTSDYEIILTYPDVNGNPTTERTIPFSDPMVTFRPATQTQAESGNNTAEIELQPNFTQNGSYEISIDAKDRSNNDFASQAYKSSFEIVTESMISNVLNYPNPFTSSTRFLMTITGSEVPQYLKIQIMTVSGKVVREINQEELGPLHIGENLTEFAWDGTDEFSDKLANGVYLYRVISRLNGQEMDRLETSEAVDNSFKNGWGKMYLMR